MIEIFHAVTWHPIPEVIWYTVCSADEEYLNIPNMSLDFDLDSEQLDLTPTATRASSLGYGIASLAAEENDDGHSGQGIALVVDAEVGICPLLALQALTLQGSKRLVL